MNETKIKKRGLFGAVDMRDGPVFSSMLKYVVPIVLSGILQSLFSAADIAVVGNFAGTSAVAAVGATSAIISFLVTVSISISSGVSIVLSRAIGAGDEQRIKRTVGTSAVLALVLGLTTAVAGVVFARPLLRLTGCPLAIMDGAVLYMRIYFLGLPATLLYNFLSPLLSLNGDTVRPFIYLAASGVLNVCLNLLFVIGLGMSVAGVAIATVISLYVSLLLLFIRITHIEGACRFSLCTLVFSFGTLRKILYYGVPSSVSGAASAFSSIYIQTIINSYGEAAISGNTAAGNLETFMFTALGAFYSAIPAFMGQNIGAGKRDRVIKVVRVGTLMTLAVGLIFGLLGSLFGGSLLSVYVPDSPEAIAFGMIRIKHILALGLVCSVTYAVGAINVGFGFSVFNGIVDLSSVCILRVIWLSLIYPLHPSAAMIYVCFPLGWALVIPLAGVRAFLGCRACKRGAALSL